MTTRNQRFQVTVNNEVAYFLKHKAKETHKSVSSIIQELINEAIDLNDDLYLSTLANEVEKRAKGKQRIPADKLWKDLGLE